MSGTQVDKTPATRSPSDTFRHDLNRRAMDRLQELLEERLVPTLDLTNALATRAAAKPGTKLYLSGDGHWTAAAHETATAVVSTWISGLRPEKEAS